MLLWHISKQVRQKGTAKRLPGQVLSLPLNCYPLLPGVLFQDSCCKVHSQCFSNLGSNCTGLEKYDWRWDGKEEEVHCEHCHRWVVVGTINAVSYWRPFYTSCDRFPSEKAAKEDTSSSIDCHCQSCLCDKRLSECFSQFPCPRVFGYLVQLQSVQVWTT